MLVSLSHLAVAGAFVATTRCVAVASILYPPVWRGGFELLACRCRVCRPHLPHQLTNGALGSTHGVLDFNQGIFAEVVVGTEQNPEGSICFHGLGDGAKRGICPPTSRQVQLQQSSGRVQRGGLSGAGNMLVTIYSFAGG